MIHLSVADSPSNTKSALSLTAEPLVLLLLILFVLLKLDWPAMLISIAASGFCLIIAMVELKKQKARFALVLLSVIGFAAVFFIYRNVFNPFNDTAYCLIACCMPSVMAAFRKRYVLAAILYSGVVYSLMRTQAIVIVIQNQPAYRTHFAIRWWWIIEFVIFIIAGCMIQYIVNRMFGHWKMKKAPST